MGTVYTQLSMGKNVDEWEGLGGNCEGACSPEWRGY